MRDVPGIPLAAETDAAAARRVAREAAEDAARTNAVEVGGFAWLLRRGPTWPPEAELDRYADFVVSYLPGDVSGRHALLAGLLGRAGVDAVQALVDDEQGRKLDTGHLAHGDLDATAIYCEDSRYTGIIDFSELRGAKTVKVLTHGIGMYINVHRSTSIRFRTGSAPSSPAARHRSARLNRSRACDLIIPGWSRRARLP